MPPCPSPAATHRPGSLALLIGFVVVVIVLGTTAPLIGRWRKRKALERDGSPNLSFTNDTTATELTTMKRAPAGTRQGPAKLPRLNESNLAVTRKIGPQDRVKRGDKQGKAERQLRPLERLQAYADTTAVTDASAYTGSAEAEAKRSPGWIIDCKNRPQEGSSAGQ